MAVSVSNNSYLRVNYITVDDLGIDPLLDTIVTPLAAISVYEEHEVAHAEKSAPDLISFDYYGTEDLWWVIMVYNGLVLYSDLVEGMQIKIPDIALVTQVLNASQSKDTTVQRVITI